MPSVSLKQHRLMVACCNDPKVAKQKGIKQEVACEFVKADEDAGLWQPEEKKDKKGKKKPKHGSSTW